MKRVLCILTAVCLLCAALSSCGKAKKKTEKFEAYSFEYFDTATSITGFAESKEAFDAIANKALEQLGEYHRLYDIYTPAVDTVNLYTINQSAGTADRTFTVDSKIIDLLVYAREMYDITHGMTNIAMGSVLKIWHDHRTIGMNDPVKASLPSMERLQKAAQHTDISHLVIDKEARTVTLTDEQMTLDVGAIAKGYATEQVAQWMEKQGVSGWILNVGGNVRAVGAKPDGSPWTVGLENPEDTSAEYLAYLSLTDEALVTSGSYQRYYIVDGQRYHHIIHPDTLMPAEGYLAVSILCTDSGMADALSTALFCLPLDEGKALIEELEGVEASWMTADGKQTVSAGWDAYVKK